MNNENFLHIYNNKIKPKIKEIDILLKTEEEITFKKTSSLLEISEVELLEILRKLKATKITKEIFFKIIFEANSFICNLIKREFECGTPSYYNYRDISYIYGIDEEKVFNAFKFLNVEFVTTNQIKNILVQIN